MLAAPGQFGHHLDGSINVPLGHTDGGERPRAPRVRLHKILMADG